MARDFGKINLKTKYQQINKNKKNNTKIVFNFNINVYKYFLILFKLINTPTIVSKIKNSILRDFFILFVIFNSIIY